MSFHFSKSFFGLIEVISTGTGLYSSDLIRLILNEKRESLLSGLDYYEKSSIKSEENLINDSLIHNKKIKDSFNYILTSLRKLLNFKNEKTSLKLLNQFFIYKNFLSPATDINKTLENESNPLTAFILNFNESKLNEICFYYFDEERMGYLKFLNCILRVVEDEDHLYYTVVKEILVDDLLEVNDNINKQAFKVLNEVTNLSILISISSLNLENLLIKNMLNQLEEHPLFKDVNILVEILGFTNDFYSEKNYFFGVDQVETKIVGPLFIAISCLLMKLIELVPEQIPQRYLKIFEMIKGVDQNGSKILSTFPSKLVEQAYNLDAIQYITRTLDTSLYKVEENSSTIYRSILKGLLTIFFYYYQLNRLPHFEQTILCLSKIFNQDENICIQFWEEDVKLLGQTTFLEVNLNRFPSSLTTFLVLIKNMIGGELSASKIFYYLGSVNTFTDFFSTEDVTGLDRAPNQPLNVNSQGRCYWKNAGRGLVHGSSSSMNLYMPEGTEGVVVSGRDFTNNTVRIQFFYNYSIWHLFISFLDSFLKTTEKVKTQDNTNHAATIETITMIMEIFYALLINSSTTLFKLFLEHTERFPTRKILEKNYFFNYLVKILTRCCEFSQPPLKLLTVVINVTSIFLTDGVNDERELFWEQFRNETFFLPRYSKVSLLNKENNKNTISFDDNNFFQTESFFQNILLPAEKRLGKYSATLSFLTLVLDFVLTLNNGFHKSKNDLSIDESKLEAINFCLIFIQKEIFSTFCDWRYVDVNEKVLIGLAIFTIFNTVFNFNCSRLTFAKDYLTEKFLSFGSETIAEKKQSLKGATGVYQVLPIVNLVGIGMKTLEYYFRLSSSTGKNFESLILESLRFLNKLLTILKYKRILNNEKRVSILEHSVLDRTTAYGINNQKEIVFVIASYIHYDYNLELPLEATNCLTLLIECSSAWENVRPPSFLGLFGENCLDTVKCFVQLALQDKGSIKFYDQNATIRDNLKAAIFKFCTAVVEYQPGLQKIKILEQKISDNEVKTVQLLNTVDIDVIPIEEVKRRYALLAKKLQLEINAIILNSKKQM
ncbi:hypothetical protein HK099_002083 [Clydaea vesicula]|uniref:Uncharacterized protein n=1 Tax=Clydaea vesicula TaxID=447962 RepID=A0AAD5U2Z1_9FUNG|nr:hypothetical protein HK099_002083 [Clydaea vesicula]